MPDTRVLVVYRTTEGQTRKVAQRIGRRLEEGGAAVDVLDAVGAPSPEGYDAAVLGDPIHYTRHSKQLTAYAKAHAASLATMPSALFQLSMASASGDPKKHEDVQRLADAFTTETGWTPDLVALFAGALAYSQYGWLKRQMMRMISGRTGGETDTSRDHEYTDWDAVDRFADEVLTTVRGHGEG